MRFEQNTYIYLYKTPLDENYRNVYDDYEDYADYHNFLLNFSYIEIPVTRVKSSRDTNGRFSVDIADYNSMDLHDYNYMEFICNNERKFAFITAIQTQNDGINSCSCQLMCKLDAWANHYLDFDKTIYYDVKRATFDGNINRNQYTSLKDMKLPMIKNIQQSYSSHYAEDTPSVNPQFTILWQRILCPNSMYYTPTIADTPNTRVSAYDNSGLGGAFVAYRPVAIVDVLSREILQGTLHVVILDRQGSALVEQEVASEALGYKNQGDYAEIGSEFVYQNDLTYIVPFNVLTDTGVNNNYYIFIGPKTGDFATLSVVKHGYLYDGPSGTGNPITAGDDSNKARFYWNLTDDAHIDKNYTIAQETLVAPSSSRYEKTYSAIVDSEEFVQEYPFRFYSILLNRREIDIKYENNAQTANLAIKCRHKLNPEVQLSLNANTVLYESAKSDGELFSSYKEYDAYWRRNQTQRQANIGIGIFGSILNASSNRILHAPLQAANTVIGEWAKQNDLRNMPEVINNPSVFSGDNSVIGNDLLLIKNVVNISIDRIKNLIIDNHFNGLETTAKIQIFTRRRDVFDYVLGNNTTIIARMSNEDKNEIENAINNGMTMWHISPAETSELRTTRLTEMNKYFANRSYSRRSL